MTNRERVMNILNYKDVDRLPIVSFGYWIETLEKWYKEGHITKDEWAGYVKYGDNSEADKSVMKRLGFDFNWNSCFRGEVELFPKFDEVILEEYPDGKKKLIDGNGLIIIRNDNIVSIPAEVGNTLKDRATWEEHYLPRLKFDEKRLNLSSVEKIKANNDSRELPLGLHCGSLYGTIRNWLGVEGSSYLYIDDEDLFKEIIDTVADLSYKMVELTLKTGIKFDYAHYWEDICFKNGPLIIPSVFEEYVGPHYKKTSKLLQEYGINILSVDCDGLIDTLVPIWLKNGVNTMFPIEVGTWNASIAPWREKYGKELRGVGGMNKTIFSKDYKAVDEEIERLKPLIELGGYIPCPDHRIAPDAIFENVQYYCDKMQNL